MIERGEIAICLPFLLEAGWSARNASGMPPQPVIQCPNWIVNTVNSGSGRPKSAKITSNALPKDTNGIYFVLTSADVNASSGFCSQYCGWHSHGTISGSDIKYSFVGNPDRCPASS